MRLAAVALAALVGVATLLSHDGSKAATILESVSVGTHPTQVAFSPDSSELWVARHQPSWEGRVAVVDTQTNQVQTEIGTGGDLAQGVDFAPDGASVYVANTFSNTVAIIDAKAMTLTKTVAVGEDPVGVVATTGRVYVVNQTICGPTASVSVIDTAANSVVATVTLPAICQDSGFASASQDESRVYVATGSGVSVIDTTTDTLDRNISLGEKVWDVAVTPDGSTAVASGQVDVRLIDLATDAVTTIPTGLESFQLRGVDVTPDGKSAYVATVHRIYVVDLELAEVVDTIATANAHNHGVAISPAGTTGYSAANALGEVLSFAAGQPVGGIAALPEVADPSGDAPIGVMAALAALLIALSGAAWYARRRRFSC